MPRPHREIPSQRLATSRAEPATAARPQRGLWLAIVITVAGWALLVYPALLLALLSIIVMTGTLDTAVTGPGIALGVLGFLATLAMLAFPLMLGLAVKAPRRSLWIAACFTGVITIAACIYVAVEWLVPFG